MYKCSAVSTSPAGTMSFKYSVNWASEARSLMVDVVSSSADPMTMGTPLCTCPFSSASRGCNGSAAPSTVGAHVM